MSKPVTLVQLKEMITPALKKRIDWYIEHWGEHVLIHPDKFTRQEMAKALATRLGVSPIYVQQRFNLFHRWRVLNEPPIH